MKTNTKKDTNNSKSQSLIIIIIVVIAAIAFIGKKFFNKKDATPAPQQLIFNVFTSDPETTISSAEECAAPGSKYEQILSEPGLNFKFNYVNLFSLPADYVIDFRSAGIMKTQSAISYKIDMGIGNVLTPVFVIKRINQNGEEIAEGEFQIITLKTSSIKTIAELENKSLITPPLENRTAIPINFFLSRKEIKFGKIQSYTHFQEGLNALDEKKVDSLIYYPGKPEVEQFLKDQPSKMSDYNVVFTSSYNYPVKILYKSKGASPEQTLWKSGLTRTIMSNPEKLKAFKYCTRSSIGEVITPEKWEQMQEMYKASANYLKERNSSAN